MTVRSLVFLLLSALMFVPSEIVSAQTVQPRLREGIREETRAVVRGSMSPRAMSAPDLGAVPASQPIHGITLVFRRSEAQEAELQRLLAAQQDSTSAEFHHWLTPEGFGQRFGMADADIEATRRWLSGKGFAVAGVSRARDRITFSGTAGQVASAFLAPLHRYQMDGVAHFAPNADLSLPANLAAVTAAVLHLSDFRPQPMYRVAAHPQFTSLATQAHYLAPKDLATMYNLESNYPGTGQTIAVVGQSYIDTSFSSEIATFQNYLAGHTEISPVLVPGTGVQAVSPGDAGESEIDLEYAGGIATSAKVFLVYVGSDPNYSVFDALAFAIDQDVAEVVSISYSECEAYLSPTDVAQSNALFEQANSQGQTLVAAAGDSGSTTCARFPISNELSAAQQQALSVGYPADSPLVTAVGGTQMSAAALTTNASTYWAGALYNDNTSSLLSYVPELAWNEGSVTMGVLAGGGGPSALFPRPSWQSGFPGMPSGSTRVLPDIALQASVAHPGFLVCSDDPYLLAGSGQTRGCTEGLEGSNNNLTVSGGTSFAAPVFAGAVAVLNQMQNSGGQGNLNPVLYQLATTSPAIFHDITAGSTACIAGADRCGAAGQSGYAAISGYDQATGLGSMDFGAFLAALAVPTSTLETTIVELSADGVVTPVGGTVNVPIAVRSLNRPQGETTPTGTVAIAVDGSVVEPAVTLSSDPTSNESLDGNASYMFVGPATPGSHLLTVRYSGDATHAASHATSSILVGNVLASGGVTLGAGSINLPANGTATTTVTATPTGGYNGRLVWSLSLTGDTSLTACYSIDSLPVQGVTSTTLLFGTGTACSSPQPAAVGAVRRITVRAAGTRSAVTPWGPVTVATGLLLCCLVPGVRRRGLTPLLCLFVVVGALSGCGGGSSASTPASTAPGSSGTSTAGPVSAYTVTLTGRDSVNGLVTASTTFALTVQ